MLDVPLFWDEPRTLQAMRPLACSCVSLHITLHVTQQEVPISFYTMCKQSPQGAKVLCDRVIPHTWAHSVLWEYSLLDYSSLDPVSRL